MWSDGEAQEEDEAPEVGVIAPPPLVTPDEQLGQIIGQLTTHLARVLSEREVLRERCRALEAELRIARGGG